MQKKLIAALCGMAIILLAACNAATPTPDLGVNPTPPPAATDTPQVDVPTATLAPPTPSATPEVAAQQAATPTPAVDFDELFRQAGLGGTLWAWTGTLYNDGTVVRVADPLRYTLEFLADGQLNALVDCNLFRGSYTLGQGGVLTAIELGAGTKIACPPDSQSGEFIRGLSAVVLSSKIDGKLVLDLQADSGSMTFAPQIILSFPAPASGAASVTAPSNLLVRSGPDVSFAAYGVIPAGTQAEIVGKFTPWWALSLPGYPRGVGWIHQQAARAENYDQVPSLPALPADYARTYAIPGLDDPQLIITDATLIRAAPDDPANPTQPALVAGLVGTNLYVIGRDERTTHWLVYLPSEIAPAGMGWIPATAARALHTDNVPVIPNSPLLAVGLPIQAEAGAPVAAARTTINYRAGPGLEYATLGFVLKSQIMPVLGRSQDGIWLQVQVPASISADRKAWVAAPNVYVFNEEKVQLAPTPLPAWVPTSITASTCVIQYQSPVNGKAFRPNQDFTLTVELLNNTRQTWSRGSTDIVFIAPLGSPDVLHTGADIYDLDYSVLPGQVYRISIPATSTFNSGDIGELWAVMQGGETVCSFTYRIYLAPTPPAPTFTPWPTQTGTIEPTPPPDLPPTPTVGTPEPTNPPEVSPTPKWGG